MASLRVAGHSTRGAALRLTERRGFARGIGALLLIGLCILIAYFLARGDAATMVSAFIRRVRAMGQPQ
jgi:hypothetical protein